MNSPEGRSSARVAEVLFRMRQRDMLTVGLVSKLRESAAMFKRERVPLGTSLTEAQANENIGVFLGISGARIDEMIENGKLRLHPKAPRNEDLLYQLACVVNWSWKEGGVTVMDDVRPDVHQVVEELMYTVRPELQREVTAELTRDGRQVVGGEEVTGRLS